MTEQELIDYLSLRGHRRPRNALTYLPSINAIIQSGAAPRKRDQVFRAIRSVQTNEMTQYNHYKFLVKYGLDQYNETVSENIDIEVKMWITREMITPEFLERVFKTPYGPVALDLLFNDKKELPAISLERMQELLPDMFAISVIRDKNKGEKRLYKKYGISGKIRNETKERLKEDNNPSVSEMDGA